MKTEPPTTPTVRTLVITWLVLVVLHFTILGLSLLRLGAVGTPLIVTLAIVQMILVMLIFMELRHGSRLVQVVSVAGFFWLFLQFTLTAGDYLTRAFH